MVHQDPRPRLKLRENELTADAKLHSLMDENLFCCAEKWKQERTVQRASRQRSRLGMARWTVSQCPLASGNGRECCCAGSLTKGLLRVHNGTTRSTREEMQRWFQGWLATNMTKVANESKNRLPHHSPCISNQLTMSAYHSRVSICQMMIRKPYLSHVSSSTINNYYVQKYRNTAVNNSHTTTLTRTNPVSSKDKKTD
jgi:hypothetical protein